MNQWVLPHSEQLEFDRIVRDIPDIPLGLPLAEWMLEGAIEYGATDLANGFRLLILDVKSRIYPVPCKQSKRYGR